MTDGGTQQLLELMRIYYPRSLFNLKNQNDIKIKLNDYMESFSKWEDQTVIQVLKDWHIEHSEAPTIADLVRECKLKEIESKPYTPLPEPEVEIVKDNPWQPALDEMLSERHNHKDPHNFLFYVLKTQGYKEYLHAREVQINCKNRRNQQNEELGLAERDNRGTEATFASEEERAKYKQMVREGKI